MRRRFAIRTASIGGAGGPQHGYQALPGSEIEPLPGARKVAPVRPCRQIEVTLLLRSRSRPSETGLESAAEQHTLLPQERTYLTREAFARSQGSDPADVQDVVRFANRHGLQIVSQNPAARTVHLSGKIANLSRAFRTPLAVYRFAGGYYRGRTGPTYIPPVLHGVVEGVFGLDNRPVAKPHFRLRRQLGGVWANAQRGSFSPTDVAKLYNFPSDVKGAGQCIAIIELGGGFRRPDLRKYFAALGIPTPKVVAVSVMGAKNSPTGDPGGPDGEVMLDIEVAGAVAPGATIAVYFAPNTNQGFLRAINRAIHDQVHRPSVISISWGGPESGWTQQALNAYNQAFQAAAALGITVCAAAGDGGSSDGVAGKRAHVDFPASSPYVLACGGTHLEAAGGTITLESVWNDEAQGGAGGGGISDFFPLPAWQAKAGVPPSVNPGKHVGRGLPDISGNADENTGYQVRVDGQNSVIGGTSAVAPLLSGLTALLNQKIGKPVGYLNPLIYSTLLAAGVFHDITQGNNDMTGQVGGYNAGHGWDAASGFGSLNGSGMLAALTGSAKIKSEPVSGSHSASGTAAVSGGGQGSSQAAREEEAASRKQKKEG